MTFYKYQGCGNDFIILDGIHNKINFNTEQIKTICDRRFGIGGDGLMILTKSNSYDFNMQYFNSDGRASSFCGNGGRCIVQFAKDLNFIKDNQVHFEFEGIEYSAKILDHDLIALSMKDVKTINRLENDLYFSTGSPHYIHFVESIDSFDLIPYAKKIRYSDNFSEGINVNIIERISDNSLKMRTYERGVEDETYSCGTGVTAAAIAYHFENYTQNRDLKVLTKGGEFIVNFEVHGGHYKKVTLIGPAKFVFKGEINL